MGKNTLIVLGFLLLCIFLSLKKEEGFATINVSEFETACNANGNICNISTSGRSEYNCINPDNIDYYDITINNTHSGNFDVSVNGCSISGERLTDQNLESTACTHSNSQYNLSGCIPKCISPGQVLGYNLIEQPSYVSNSSIQDAAEGSTCNSEQGYYPARDVCFDNSDGTITNDRNPDSCRTNNGHWYDGVNNNSIKYICGTGPNNYSVMGCEPGCLSRINNSDYTTLDSLEENKELIQLFDRVDNDVVIKMTNTSPYNLTENNLAPGITNFDVSGEPQTVVFKSDVNDENEQGLEVDFGGEVISRSCDLQSGDEDLKRKYHISGLFPICDSSLYECLNFNISYDSDAPLNINEFKTRMAENTSEILGQSATSDDIANYQNSLYYYRRYKDNEGRTNIEGQIRCDNDSESPFHCEIFNEDVSSGYLLSESKGCIPLRSRDKIGGVVLSGGVDSAKATCNANDQCLGFTFNNILGSYQLVSAINQVDQESSSCYQKI